MTVAVCDRYRLFAEALVQALRAREERAIIVLTPSDILEVASVRPLTSVVLDAGFPHGSAALTTRWLRNAWPDTAVICLAEEPGDVDRCREAGAHLVLSKRQPLSDLVEAALWPSRMRSNPSSARHGHARGGQSARPLATNQPLPAQFLTKRERDVLALLVTAESTSGIAERLGISVTTARGYIQSAFLKLGVHSRVEAVTYALKHGIVSPSADRTDPAPRNGTTGGASRGSGHGGNPASAAARFVYRRR